MFIFQIDKIINDKVLSRIQKILNTITEDLNNNEDRGNLGSRKYIHPELLYAY
jgi:hypothetical protein